MEENLIEIIIQGGAVGVALVALLLTYKVMTNHHRHTDNVIEKNTEAFTNLAGTIGEQREVLRGLKDTIEKKL